MTDSLDEKISALLDGELSEFEFRSVLKDLEADESRRKRLERYQLTSDALQRNLPPAIDPQFSSRIMQALDNEPAILAPRTTPVLESETVNNPWKRRFAGFAVAASVAMMAVFGVQTMNQHNPAMDPLAGQPMAQLATPKLATPLPTPVPAQQFAQVVEHKTPSSPVDAAHERFVSQHLNKYLVDHSQRAAQARVQGVMPYARIITYPAGAQQESARR